MLLLPEFLTSYGTLNTDGRFIPTLTKAASTAPITYAIPLTDLGELAASGIDAGAFLHKQLSNDILNLPQNQAQWAGYCSVKGRLLATFLHWQIAGTHYLQTDQRLLGALQKRLSMFILRAKVTLHDASAAYSRFGLYGPRARPILEQIGLSVPDTAYACTHQNLGTVIAMPWSDSICYEVHVPATEAKKIWHTLLAEGAQIGSGMLWHALQINAGIVQIVPETQDKYVPQMVNFELVGGVNFKKGCYPGQEVVARSQYLGKLKRRMTRARVTLCSDESVTPGADVYHATHPHEPVGSVVNAACVSGNSWEILIETPADSQLDGTLHLGAISGPTITLLGLPYAIPDNLTSTSPKSHE